MACITFMTPLTVICSELGSNSTFVDYLKLTEKPQPSREYACRHYKPTSNQFQKENNGNFKESIQKRVFIAPLPTPEWAIPRFTMNSKSQRFSNCGGLARRRLPLSPLLHSDSSVLGRKKGVLHREEEGWLHRMVKRPGEGPRPQTRIRWESSSCVVSLHPVTVHLSKHLSTLNL